MARNPRVFLKEGDKLELTVAGLGTQHHTLVASNPRLPKHSVMRET